MTRNSSRKRMMLPIGSKPVLSDKQLTEIHTLIKTNPENPVIAELARLETRLNKINMDLTVQALRLKILEEVV